MDITSFILGRKNGRDSVKTQEKTVTPSESEIVVTPDAGFDALAKVVVEAVAAGGGSGDSSGYQFKSASVKVEAGADAEYRFNVDFGFQPDFLLVFASGQATRQTQTARVYFGFSAAAIETFGLQSYTKNIALTEGTNDWMYRSGSNAIEDTTTTWTGIYGADPTGFNVGYKPQTSCYYYIYAYKFPL